MTMTPSVKRVACRVWMLCGAVGMAVAGWSPTCWAQAATAPAPAPARATGGIDVPAEAAPIIRVADVRIGMRGYGMTVFQGTEPEPFAVEVMAVAPQATPQHAVVWVRCHDARLEKSGPVQGMSGSPIYLWAEGEAQELGQGGLLLGAFAFGYANTNDAMVGVQPIEYMRQTGAGCG